MVTSFKLRASLCAGLLLSGCAVEVDRSELYDDFTDEDAGPEEDDEDNDAEERIPDRRKKPDASTKTKKPDGGTRKPDGGRPDSGRPDGGSSRATSVGDASTRGRDSGTELPVEDCDPFFDDCGEPLPAAAGGSPGDAPDLPDGVEPTGQRDPRSRSGRNGASQDPTATQPPSTSASGLRPAGEATPSQERPTPIESGGSNAEPASVGSAEPETRGPPEEPASGAGPEIAEQPPAGTNTRPGSAQPAPDQPLGGSDAMGPPVPPAPVSERCAGIDASVAMAFMTKHCLACHAGDSPYGRVSLDTVEEVVAAKARIAGVVFLSTPKPMPPEGLPAGSEADVQALRQWLDCTE